MIIMIMQQPDSQGLVWFAVFYSIPGLLVILPHHCKKGIVLDFYESLRCILCFLHFSELFFGETRLFHEFRQ